ncbi:recombinase family protein [Bifidobacterium sp. ESL0775]|uniref:recombinase family protein n=1 Tax=Bifidobacterium sp. ESL0775 TaxID=2983230 RepID=UPI0023F761F6|nr:recombinase family protein [Bifidobacterium sp. ESL0775]WEV68841.1 recombinase family protein [Bifidobacterium sp. ESL0775]
MLIGYARVSTLDQNEDLQVDALVKAGCERGHIYVDHASGAKEHRPQLDLMLQTLREGDTVVVWKLDRMGRSLQNLVNLMNRFQEAGVGFKSLTENIDATTSGGMLVYNIFAAMAQFERDLIRERTNAGLQAARRRGRKGGRKPKLTPAQAKRARELYESGTVTVNEIASQYNVGRTTIYRTLQQTKKQ